MEQYWELLLTLSQDPCEQYGSGEGAWHLLTNRNETWGGAVEGRAKDTVRRMRDLFSLFVCVVSTFHKGQGDINEIQKTTLWEIYIYILA